MVGILVCWSELWGFPQQAGAFGQPLASAFARHKLAQADGPSPAPSGPKCTHEPAQSRQQKGTPFRCPVPTRQAVKAAAAVQLVHCPSHMLASMSCASWLGGSKPERLCRYFGSLEYDWRGISQQPTLAAKAKRSLAQLGPKEVWFTLCCKLGLQACMSPPACLLRLYLQRMLPMVA